jgi:hypothetical protein
MTNRGGPYNGRFHAQPDAGRPASAVGRTPGAIYGRVSRRSAVRIPHV